MLATEHLWWLLMNASLLEAHREGTHMPTFHSVLHHTALPHIKQAKKLCHINLKSKILEGALRQYCLQREAVQSHMISHPTKLLTKHKFTIIY